VYIGQILPELAAANASVMRIQRYLFLEEKLRDICDNSTETSSSHKAPEGDSRESMPLERMTTSIAITMDAASFAWIPNTDSCLRDITIYFDQPALYICVGHIASVYIKRRRVCFSLLTAVVPGQVSPPLVYLRREHASRRLFRRPSRPYRVFLTGSPYSPRHHL
jgi:hypothetical protein